MSVRRCYTSEINMSDFMLRAVDRSFPPSKNPQLHKYMMKLIRWKGRDILKNVQDEKYAADSIVVFEYYVVGSLEYMKGLIEHKKYDDVGKMINKVSIPASRNVLTLIGVVMKKEVELGRLEKSRGRELFQLAEKGTLPEQVGTHLDHSDSSSDESSESSDEEEEMTIEKLDEHLKRVENQIAKVLQALNIN